MIEKHVNALKERVLEYGSLIDRMLQQTFDGVICKDRESLSQVYNELEIQADAMKLEIAQESMGLIALFHPEACHLRSIIKMSAIAIDLERMGDVIVKIARISLNNKDFLDFTVYPQIMQMVQETRIMLTNVMRAFADGDALIAISVIGHDDRVDALCESLIRKILREIKTHNDDIERLLQFLTIVRYIERIADHTTHIAKDVIFIKEGLTVQKMTNLQGILAEHHTKEA